MNHPHIQSLYVHCEHCTMLGTPMGDPFETVACGNCGKPTDRWLVPQCCILELADKINEQTQDALVEASKKLGW